MFRQMRIGTLDLYETFAADGLIAATRLVEVGRVREEANGTFGRVLVEKNLERLAIDEWILRTVHLLGCQICRGGIA
jgi:hypothetical protein